MMFPHTFFHFVQANPDKGWNWQWLSRNPNITWEIVQANPYQDWNWYGLSINPNITSFTTSMDFHTTIFQPNPITISKSHFSLGNPGLVFCKPFILLLRKGKNSHRNKQKKKKETYMC